jgi:PrgI family protein
MTMQAHKVPTHMAMPDRIVCGLTAKQLLTTLIGCSMGYHIWLHLSALLTSGIIGLITRLVCSLVPAAVALSIALITVAGRSLEVWALVALRYWLSPRAYVWCRVGTSAPRHTSQQPEASVPEYKSRETAFKTPALKLPERG